SPAPIPPGKPLAIGATTAETERNPDGTLTLRLVRVIKAPAERIYECFLDSDAMVKWLPPHGFTGHLHRNDAKVGGGYRMSFATSSEAMRGTLLPAPPAETAMDLSRKLNLKDGRLRVLGAPKGVDLGDVQADPKAGAILLFAVTLADVDAKGGPVVAAAKADG